MSDIVERLRAGICDDPCRVRDIPSGCACAEAAARIERLEKLLQEIMEQCPEHVPHGLKNQIRAALEDRT